MATTETPQLVALSMTTVHYNPHDPLSHLLAYLTLTPQLLFAVYLTLLYSTREVEIALTFAGQLACEALNVLLKRWFKELRPEVMRELHRGYGMPSSHAQFVSYFAVYVALFLLWRHSPSVRTIDEAEAGSQAEDDEGESSSAAEEKQRRRSRKGRRRKASVVINGVERPLNPANPIGMDGAPSLGKQQAAGVGAASPVYSLQLHHPRLTHTLLTLAVIAVAIVVAASRIYLQYHTTKQVLVGATAGSGFAVLWFGVTEWLRRAGWVQWALELAIVRSARVRDLVCEEDLVELGWQVWEDKRMRRRVGMRHAKGSKSGKSR